MYFAIDFDTLTVESKSEEGEDLATYVLDNDLSLAVAVVSSPEDLALEFTAEELGKLYEELTMEEEKFLDEDRAAKYVWEALVSEQDSIPSFTAKLGKKLLKEAAKRSSDRPQTETTAKVVKATSKPKKAASGPRVKLDDDTVIKVVDGKCKNGSILHTIVTAIEEDMIDTVAGIRDYITSNHTIPKTGELADVKFADHNIKYFIKQGKLEEVNEL